MIKIKTLHNDITKILKDVNEICESKGIKYIPIAGSSIGAARNHGFIPWDDDFDIGVRADQIKLLTDELSKKYEVYGNKGMQRLHFTKVIIKDNKYENKYYSKSPSNGPFIDIFPMYDYSVKSVKKFMGKTYKMCEVILQIHDYPMKRIFRINKNILTKIIVMVLALIIKVIIPIPFLAGLYKSRIIRKASKRNDSNELFRITFFKKISILKKSWFENTKKINFESTELIVPIELDKMLDETIPNWRIIPDEKDQVTTHFHNIIYKKGE